MVQCKNRPQAVVPKLLLDTVLRIVTLHGRVVGLMHVTLLWCLLVSAIVTTALVTDCPDEATAGHSRRAIAFRPSLPLHLIDLIAWRFAVFCIASIWNDARTSSVPAAAVAHLDCRSADDDVALMRPQRSTQSLHATSIIFRR